MSLLALALPRLSRARPFSRDQSVLLLAALNLLFIAVDVYLAHSISGAIKPSEWIPILFGVAGGLALLGAGILARRDRLVATALANGVFLGSVGVGALGAFFHLGRVDALASGLISLEALSAFVWAPPVIGPLFFMLIAALGISAAWIESPADSGRLRLWAGRRLQLPYSKTRAYLFITALFILATLISSVLDHARLRFDNPWVWLPVSAGLFALATCLFLGLVRSPSGADVAAHLAAMLLLMAVGAIGLVLHAEASLTASGEIVIERFLRGSPLMAPLLFCNAGLMGLLAVLDPREP